MSASQYPKGSIMTPYIDSHDTARFVTMATYRGQPGYEMGVAGNKWSSYAGPPPHAEPRAVARRPSASAALRMIAAYARRASTPKRVRAARESSVRGPRAL